MKTILQYKFIIIGGALVIAVIAWYVLSPTPENTDLASTPAPAGTTPAEAGIVPTLLTLRSVKLDGTIFSEPAFQHLKDFSTEIVPEPVGRSNPFAPLGARNTSLAATSTQISTPR